MNILAIFLYNGYLLFCKSKKEKIDFYDLKTYGFMPYMLETLQVLINKTGLC